MRIERRGTGYREQGLEFLVILTIVNTKSKWALNFSGNRPKMNRLKLET